jgi:hypothetical protein
MTSALTPHDSARQAIAEATDLDQVKDIRAKAKAMRVYAREALDRERLGKATETQILAEIRIGEMLLSLGERRGGKQTSRNGSLPSNKELGLTDKQSSLWKQLAALSPEERTAAIEEAKERVADAIEKRRRKKAASEHKDRPSPLEAGWAKASEEARHAFMAADDRRPYLPSRFPTTRLTLAAVRQTSRPQPTTSCSRISSRHLTPCKRCLSVGSLICAMRCSASKRLIALRPRMRPGKRLGRLIWLLRSNGWQNSTR